MANLTATRTIALIEGAKGVVVLLAGLGLLRLIHHDVQHLAERLVRLSHLNPASHIPRIFLEASARVDDHHLLLLALGALAYAVVRLAEAYGLWHDQAWAEWFAVVAGGLYVPVELKLLLHRFTPLHLVVVVTNLLIVAYLAWHLMERRRQRAAASPPADG